MAKFKVLRPIEQAGTLYLPEGAKAPAKPRSAGSGAEVKVDSSGVIELTDAQAAEMTLGQIAALAAPAPPPAPKAAKGKVRNGD
jgi:hypothetical protein